MKKLALLAVVAFAAGLVACKPATTKAPEAAMTPPPAPTAPAAPAPVTPPPAPAQPGQ